MNLSVLIVSKGRNSLHELLIQLSNDLKENDEVLIVMDNVKKPYFHDLFDNRFKFIVEKEETGYWGHPIRTKYQNSLKGYYILNMDDDDLYTDFWRDSIENILRRLRYPNILFCNFTDYKNEKNRERFDNDLNCVTGSVVVKNTSENNKVVWENFYGGDQKRYKIIKNKSTFGSTDFVLIKKN